MSSTRRLAISSLLCDDDDKAPQQSPSPTRDSHANTRLNPYASPVWSALPTSPDDARYVSGNSQSKAEHSPFPVHTHFQPLPPPPPAPAPRLASPLHPLSVAAPMIPHRSPTTNTGHSRHPVSTEAHHRRSAAAAQHAQGRWEEEGGHAQWGSGDFPRHRTAQASYPTEQPRPPSSMPSPPPSSAGSLLSNLQERRRDRDRDPYHQLHTPMSPYGHSPTRGSPPSSSTSQKFMLNPTHTMSNSSPESTHSIRHLLNNDTPARISPISTQRQELGIAPLRRPVPPTVVSPVAPRSALPGGPSGLDLLMQAATAEQERIEHRRLSGGDEPSDVRSQGRLSIRSDVRLPPPMPSAPPSASSRVSTSFPTGESDVRSSSQRYDSDREDRVSKRRRSSAEGTRVSEPLQQTVHLESPKISTSQLNRSPELDLARRPPSPRAPSKSPMVQEYTPLPKTEKIPARETQIQVTQPPSEPGPSTSRVTPSVVNTVEEPSVPAPVERRSPPRSRIRPKKPGSVALALVEKELREVALSEEGSSKSKSKPDERKASNEFPTVQESSVKKSSQTHVEANLAQSKKSIHDEQDVNDFFMSTFDSPKLAEERIPAKPKPLAEPSVSHAGSSTERSHPVAPDTKSNVNSTNDNTTSSRTVPSYPVSLNTATTADKEQVVTGKELGDPVLDELLAAGAATSEDERTEYDEHDADTMEVDVENELLSLVDGPPVSHPQPSPKQPTADDLIESQSPVLAQEPDQNLQPVAESSKAKAVKKPSAKPKAPKIKTGDSLDSTTAKPKAAEKPRPAKNDKAKGAKKSKETTVVPVAPLPTPDSAKPPEDFPLVTSSGRMITKSKKSAAASASLVPEVKAVGPIKKKASGAAGTTDGSGSRSRSHSAMPRASVDPDAQAEKALKPDEDKVDVAAAAAEEDEKLYCICKTMYDEERVMIACDRCDEWYHTQCINMSDLEVDLVDQFICPNCATKHPELQLQTTYKQRCFSGTSHPEPDSPDACHKPSRGNISKYCSDECGVRHLHRKIQTWAGQGGDVNGLWESVKDAKKREGQTKSEPNRRIPQRILAEIQNTNDSGGAFDKGDVKSPVTPFMPSNAQQDSAIERLNAQLQKIVTERETRKKELEVIAWRDRLLQLASDRSDHIETCGWDQRLCFGDEEIVEFGEGVFESYEEVQPTQERTDGDMDTDDQGMDVDGQAGEGEWWCTGKKKCDRHAGWQKLRSAELKAQRNSNEDALSRLTTRERELRNKIEDIRYPQSRSGTTLKFSLTNANTMEENRKRGKKKSVPAVA